MSWNDLVAEASKNCAIREAAEREDRSKNPPRIVIYACSSCMREVRSEYVGENPWCNCHPTMHISEVIYR